MGAMPVRVIIRRIFTIVDPTPAVHKSVVRNQPLHFRVAFVDARVQDGDPDSLWWFDLHILLVFKKGLTEMPEALEELFCTIDVLTIRLC